MKRSGYRSRWKTAGIIILCLVLGLALGVGAGFLVQREFGGSKSVEESKAKTETGTNKAEDESAGSEVTGGTDEEPATESGSTVPATTPASSTVPVIEVKGKTPVDAMTAYLEAVGIESNGMMFSVVSASKTDPNWKLDKGVKGGETLYFVVHYTNGGWTVETYGPSLTGDDLASVDAPLDLTPP